MHVLAFDIGTSGVKSVVVDAAGTLVDSAYRGYGLDFVGCDGVEQDLGLIMEHALQSARELLDRSTVSAADIHGISVTAQMFNLVAVDTDGRPLHPMISWLDQRCEAQARTLASTLEPDQQFKLLDAVVSGKDIIPKILWLRDNHPEIYSRTAKLLDCKDAAVLYLTGAAVTDHTGASAYRLFDHDTRDWDTWACDAVGIDVDKLPRVRAATDIAGLLRPDICATLGLPHQVPVYVGAGDVPASQLGAGAVEVGDVHISMGTAAYFGMTTAAALRDPAERLGVLAHAVRDRWLLWLEIATGGAALAWAVRLLGLDRDGSVDYAEVERLVRENADDMDELIFAPWLSGERVPVFDDSARASFIGLALHHGPGHVLRSVMEGVAFQMRWALEYGLRYGQPIGRIRAVGGGSMGAEWIQIITDVLDRPLETIAAPQDAGAVGAAACAIVGIGAQPDYSFLVDRVEVTNSYRPDPVRARCYTQRYHRFRQLYETLRPLYQPQDSQEQP